MLDGFHRKADVQVGPVEVIPAEESNVLQLPNAGVMEPRIQLKGEECLTVGQQQPEAVLVRCA